VSAATLSRILQENRNLPRTFTLGYATLNGEQIRALETASIPDVDVKLIKCSLSDGDVGCREAFIECLQSDGCLVQLQDCEIDCQVLATALTGNSCVTRLVLPVSLRNDANMAVLYKALASSNKGMLYLNWNMCPTCDENLSSLCQSLEAHPTLTCLDLRDIRPMGLHGDRFVAPEDIIFFRRAEDTKDKHCSRNDASKYSIADRPPFRW
jgi:hypothetical protein